MAYDYFKDVGRKVCIIVEIAEVAEGKKGGEKTNPDAQISQRRIKGGLIHWSKP